MPLHVRRRARCFVFNQGRAPVAFLSYLGTNDASVNLWPQCTAEYLRLFKNVTRD